MNLREQLIKLLPFESVGANAVPRKLGCIDFI